jgi:hypothetical protein
MTYNNNTENTNQEKPEFEGVEIWPKPLLFDDISTPQIAAHLLPDDLANFVKELAESTETPPEMAMACVLGVASIALAGKFIISPKKGWRESLNTYWFIELPPANLKSKVIKACTSPLTQWEREQRKEIQPEIDRAKSRRKSHEMRVEHLRKDAAKAKSEDDREKLMQEIETIEQEMPTIPVVPLLFANNVTPESLENSTCEQGGMFAVVSDEGGVIATLTGLYSKGNANVDIILKGIDGGDMRIKRKERDIDMNPFLTFILCVQPIVRDKMGRNQCLQGNGALERFLYLIPRSKVGHRTHDTKPMHDRTKEAYHDAILRLLNIPIIRDDTGRLNPRFLRLSREAKATFHSFQLWLEPMLKAGGELYPLQGWGGKIAGFSLRIAALLHVVSGKDENAPISDETLQFALEIARQLIGHAKVAFRLMGLEDAIKDGQYVCDWLKATGALQLTRTDLVKAMRHHLKADQLDVAMQELESRHIVATRQEKGKGTKDVTIYDVNPQIFES